MPRRDNVKARKRLKKPKKIHTNASTNQVVNFKLKAKKIRVSKRHTSAHKSYYYDADGKVRVARDLKPRISILVQTSRQTKYNKWGLQGDMSPQRLRYIKRDIDILLMSKNVSPKLRKAISDRWNEYISASFIVYRSKNPERVKEFLGKIREIERNPALLGFRQTFIKEKGVKEAYIMSQPTDKSYQNLENYENWYNEQLDKKKKQKAEKEKDVLVADFDIFGQDFSNTPQDAADPDQEDTGEEPINLDDLGTGADDATTNNYTWDEYMFYDLHGVAQVIDDMGGWQMAIEKYAADVDRLAHCAGYSTHQVEQYITGGYDPGAPDPELVWDNIFNSSYNNGTIMPRFVDIQYDNDGNIIAYRDK